MKSLSILMLTAIAVTTASSQSALSTALQVNPQAQTYLYGGGASKVEGDIKKRGGDNFAWKGDGAITWDVQVAKAGEYAVALCYAAEAGAQEFEIAGGGAGSNTPRETRKAHFEATWPMRWCR